MTLRLSRGDLNGKPAAGRYDRQTKIEWWDQERVHTAQVLVVGAGALGNEVLKNLALIGVGRVLAYDMDSIEQSNLSRGVLFRDEDEGAGKAATVVRRMRELNPEITTRARAENVIHRAGLGVFAWANVVIAGLDNREARIFVNSACARTGRVWVDGAIEGLSGVVRVFDPADSACYECTMNETDRKLVAARRSCAMLARDVVESGSVPNTNISASLIGALQVQEAIKLLHGQPSLVGSGLHVQGLWNEIDRIRYQRREDCPGHDTLGEIVPLGAGVADVTFAELLDRAENELGDEAVLDLSRDLVLNLTCPTCEASMPGRAVVGEICERDANCPGCGTHRIVQTVSTVDRDGQVDLECTPADLGLPPYDVIVARQGLERRQAWLFDGDAAAVLGPLAGFERSEGQLERS